MDFLDRNSAPLTAEEWQKIDEAVIGAARNILTARKVIDVLGPMGTGTWSLPYSVFSGSSGTGIDMTGESEEFVVQSQGRVTVSLPVLYQNFRINWRDVETDRQLGVPFDVSTAATAAVNVALQEDSLIFNGNEKLGLAGLFTATGRQTVALRDWEETGAALGDVVQAVGALTAAGHPGPFAMVVSPRLFGRLVRAYANTGMLELDQVKALLRGNVLPSNAIAGNKGVVIATGTHYMQIALGQDFAAGYLGPVAMNHQFRVMETAALLIRRPDAICTIE